MPRKRSSSTASAREQGPPDQATAYARAVAVGEVVAGPLVRLACARHLRDLERKGLTWDREEAERSVAFFPTVLRLNGGDFEGVPFELQPWQAFIVGSLFGWKVAGGARRYRVAYVEVAKGNGKSPLAAGVGLKMLTADNEPRAEVYSAATKKDQAMILFRDAVAMVDQSPALSKRLKKSGEDEKTWNLSYPATGSWFRPISSDDGQSGPRPHCGLIDELHEHKTATTVNMMRKGTKGRRQALIFEITNSGYDRQSICWQHHDYSRRVLEGTAEDDSWFAFVCGLDDGDDWRDEQVWRKANPNLGVSISVDYLRDQVREAVGMPANENVTRRLNFCEWTEQDERWIALDAWDACAGVVDLDAMAGRPCFGGLDLSSTTDLSAFALLFPPYGEDDLWRLAVWFWLPAENLTDRGTRDRAPYQLWADRGLIEATPGPVIDYQRIRARINDLRGRFRIEQIGFDPWNATQICSELIDDGHLMVQVSQGMQSMSPPTKEFERLLRGGKLAHGGNAVLRYCASNVTVRADAEGNMKPSKSRSTGRIDGISATIIALERASRTPLAGGVTSVADVLGLAPDGSLMTLA